MSGIPAAGMGFLGFLAQCLQGSSVEVSNAASCRSVTRLYDHAIQSIMKFLSLQELSRAARTCRQWRYAVISCNKLYQDIAQNEFSCRSLANATLRIIAGHIAPSPIPSSNPRQMYLEPFFGERAWRLANVDPEFVPPFPFEAYRAILKEPRPFTASIIVPVLLLATVNGERTCLDVLQEVYRSRTGSGYNYYCNYAEAERVRHGRTPMGPSSWYLMTVVLKSAKKNFKNQTKLVNPSGHGPWEVASATQVMALEVLSLLATGKSFLGNFWARTPQKTLAGWLLTIFGGSASSAPEVHYGAGDARARIVVVALRKLPLLRA